MTRSINSHAGQGTQAVCRNSCQIDEVAERIGSSKKNHLKILIHNSHLTCNLQIAAVVAHLADQRKRTGGPRAIRLHLKLLQLTAKLLKPTQPISALAEASLQVGIQMKQNMGIQARAGHQEKMLRGPIAKLQPARRDSPRHAPNQVARGTLDAAAYPDFVGQYICRAGRQHAHRHCRPDHSAGYLIDGAVSASRYNQVASVAQAIRRYTARRPRSSRRMPGYPAPLRCQRPLRPVQPLDLCASQPTRVWIIDKRDVLVQCD